MDFIPKCVFLTRGVGTHRHQLTAFEYALREADIEQQNLVSVSSILPPGCDLIDREAGIAALRPGEITFCILARAETNEPGRRISASVGLARPADPKLYGYISEHHGFGMTEEESSDYAEDLAASMPRPSASSSIRTLPGTSAGTSTGRVISLSIPLDHGSCRRRTARRLDLRSGGRRIPLHTA